MIYLTGDTHGDWDRFLDERLADRLGAGDILIVCGDFGYIWACEGHDDFAIRVEAKHLDDLAKLPYRILFVDGNHENFARLEAFPEVTLYGDKAHKIRENIYHLQRGGVYEIEGKRFFCFGGAASVDKWMRVPNRSWWARELPDKADFARAEKSIARCGGSLDYILTHTAPVEIIQELGFQAFGAEDVELTSYLSYVMHHCDFKKWFFGHFHVDRELRFVQSNLFSRGEQEDVRTADSKAFRALYFDVVPLEEKAQ